MIAYSFIVHRSPFSAKVNTESKARLLYRSTIPWRNLGMSLANLQSAERIYISARSISDKISSPFAIGQGTPYDPRWSLKT